MFVCRGDYFKFDYFFGKPTQELFFYDNFSLWVHERAAVQLV